MRRHDLSEIDLQEGDRRTHLRRRRRARAPPRQPSPPPPPPAAAEPPARKLLEIRSPTVGTFYAQKEPGAPPYVTVGSRVTPDTIVCMIEAMKVYTELPAGVSGVIAEVLVNNKDFVE